MKKMILVLAFLFTLLGTAQAQEKDRDVVKVYAGFTNITVPGDNIQGVNGQLQLKLFGLGEYVKVEAAGDYAAFFPASDIYIHTFQGGPQVGIDVADRKVTLFGRSLFGVITTFNSDSTYSYLIGGGADLNVSRRFFLRGGYDRQFVRDAGV